ncbi:SDR family NAD(P)-dependent oxidoreductase [Candidatus Omnitrophota bacterium]
MGNKLKERVAVVTGSGQGIGRAIAIALAEEGARVVTNDIQPGIPGGDAETIAMEINNMGGQAVPFYGEIGCIQVGQNLIDAAVDNFGRIDILVNNAGINRDRMVWNMSEEEWDTVIGVILKGTFACTRSAVARMREQQSGRIINITSESGLHGNAGQPNYSAAKAGIIGFTKSCALALGKYGITVNAIAPQAATRIWRAVTPKRAREMGVVRGLVTDEQAASFSDEEVYNKIFGEPEDVAPLVVYLASDAAANINGQIFYASGGRIAIYAPWTQVESIYKKGRWTLEELESVMPGTLASNLVNPAPAESLK